MAFKNLPIAHHSLDYNYVTNIYYICNKYIYIYIFFLKWVKVFLALTLIGLQCMVFTGYVSFTQQSRWQGVRWGDIEGNTVPKRSSFCVWFLASRAASTHISAAHER